MKQIAALILAWMLILPTLPLVGPSDGLAHAGRTAGASVPLTNLSPATSQNTQLLSSQNPGHFQQAPLTQGVQLGDRDAYVEYALDGRYTTLTGTLYGDDSTSTTGTILIVNSTRRTPVVLLRLDVPQGARRPFQVAVRGIGHLMVEQTQCCGVDVDMVARITPGPRVPVPPVTGTPLNATTQETAKESQPLTLQQPGHFQGLLLAHGFQLGDKDAYVGYALNGAYSTLSGTLYADDSSSTTATIVIVDTTARTPRVLFRSDVPQGARKHFVVAVRGVGHLMVEQTKCCGIAVDVVAAMARGPRIPVHPGTGTALEAAPIDTSQGSQLLTLDNPGHFTGVLITDGFQLGDSGAYATYLLQHRYTTLAGTLYGDDASSATGTITLQGQRGATTRLLARLDVPQGAQRTFHISVRGVDRIMVAQTQCCGVYVDVVAALQR